MILQAQNKIISATPMRKNEVVKSDTALYDVYGLKYKLSQPIKYIIQHSSIGAATAFSLYSISALRGDIQDEMGIGFMAMPIIGGFIGLISGTVYGIYKGNADEKTRKVDDTFYHKSGKYGYCFGVSSSNRAKKFSLTNAITVKTESDIKILGYLLLTTKLYICGYGISKRPNAV